MRVNRENRQCRWFDLTRGPLLSEMKGSVHTRSLQSGCINTSHQHSLIWTSLSFSFSSPCQQTRTRLQAARQRYQLSSGCSLALLLLQDGSFPFWKGSQSFGKEHLRRSK